MWAASMRTPSPISRVPMVLAMRALPRLLRYTLAPAGYFVPGTKGVYPAFSSSSTIVETASRSVLAWSRKRL